MVFFQTQQHVLAFVLSFWYLIVVLTLVDGQQGGGEGNDNHPIPEPDLVAQVKAHRFGAAGELVPGQEHMRKLTVQWSRIPNALAYQVCHNCEEQKSSNKDDEGGSNPIVEVGDNGKIIDVSIETTKGGRPVMVLPDAPLGWNTCHIRASMKEGIWGPWSEERLFFVEDPGNVAHMKRDEL